MLASVKSENYKSSNNEQTERMSDCHGCPIFDGTDGNRVHILVEKNQFLRHFDQTKLYHSLRVFWSKNLEAINFYRPSDPPGIPLKPHSKTEPT